MGVRARHVVGVALLLCAACKAVEAPPSVGSPGLEPPSMTGDAGGVPGHEPSATGGTAAPVTPGDTTGLPGAAGSFSGGAGGGAGGGSGGSGGAAGSQGQPIDELDAGTEIAEGNALFTGLWVIDQPTHALYEATLYELTADGTITVHDTMLLGAEPWPGYVTGSVENADRSVRCVFEGRWQSLEARGVELDARCTDATTRTVQVELPADQDPATGVSAVVLSVNGESGWDHRDWPWSWRKCQSRDACVPF